jgi:hypothetical protein
MENDCKFEIPEKCREFGKTVFDERRLVANKFVQEFAKHAAPPKDSDERNEEWTRSVRGRFIEICPIGCRPIPENRQSTRGEFLVDYLWEEKENGRRIILAGESEWGMDKYGKNPRWRPVEADFEKLLAVKSPFKVLIFSSNCNLPDSQGEMDGDFSIGFAKERLEASLRRYGHHIPGEVYVFIDGKFQSSIWLAKQFGKETVNLLEGPGGDLIRP